MVRGIRRKRSGRWHRVAVTAAVSGSVALLTLAQGKDVLGRLKLRACANVARGRLDTADIAAIIALGDK